MEYCSYEEYHHYIYYAKISPTALPAKEKPFESQYTQKTPPFMDESIGLDVQDANDCDNMDIDRYDG